jgi:hypothetical protein
VKNSLHILRELARRYERTQAGRTGSGERDLLLSYEQFLSEAGCCEGESRAAAERVLADAAHEGVLALETHRRDPRLVERIRFSSAKEEVLFARLGETSPTARRNRLAKQFTEAVHLEVPPEFRQSWTEYFGRLPAAASRGEPVAPFHRDDFTANAELLTLIPKLLEWRGESLRRFASCVLCGESKRLEALAGRLSQILAGVTAGRIQTLEELGIIENPRFALVHGPLRFRLDGQWLDLGSLRGPFRLAQIDIERAEEITTTARRCLTVENETSFHELAKLNSGELLIQTSYPGAGTLALLKRLPAALEFWHFGDSDEAGFDILRVLREKSAREFKPLHMTPGRTPFEQESLGRPPSSKWPYYP